MFTSNLHQPACAVVNDSYGVRGITYIEVVITSLIIAAVLGGLAGVFLFGLDSWEKGKQRIAIQQLGSMTLRRLVRDIQRSSVQATAPGAGGSDLLCGTVDSTRRFSFVDNAVMVDDSILFPQFPAESLAVVPPADEPAFAIIGGSVPGMQVAVRFRVTSVSAAVGDTLDFSTIVTVRNP